MLLLAMLFALSACERTAGAKQSDDSLTRILASGELVLGMDNGFPPMGFTDAQGNFTGFDVEIARAVCARLGVALKVKAIDWDKKEEELNEGRIDCIWNGLSKTPARAESMTLSDPYMQSAMIFVVPGSSTVMNLRDLSGCSVGVQSASSAEEVLLDSELASSVTIQKYQTNLDLLQRLSQGEVDAALLDSVAAYYFIISSEERFFILPDSLAEEEYVIGFRKGENALCEKVQEILSEMKADGTLGKISKRWFGSDITTVR